MFFMTISISSGVFLTTGISIARCSSSLVRNTAIILVQLASYEKPPRFLRAHRRRAASHARVEDDIAFVCIVQDKFLEQIRVLLRRMEFAPSI